MRKLVTQSELTEAGHGSRTKVWRDSRNPDHPFPPPVEIGPNSVRWWADEIKTYEKNLRRRGPMKTPAEPEDEDEDSEDSEPEEEEAEPP